MDIDQMTVEEIWEQIAVKAKENLDLIQGMNATYTFQINDGEKKEYSLILKDGDAEVKNSAVDPSDCQLSMNEKNFKKLLQGKLNAASAFMTGRLKVKGNIGEALKLEGLLKKYEF